ncbi:MAG: hypothetical protein F4146_05155 [Rhodothermaceae bacterium]|nr:hypothetical protein [Rhodothermaceae bacterium]
MNRNTFDSPVTLQMVLEALAFATDAPVSVKEVCRVYAEVVGETSLPSEAAVEEALEELND